MVICSFVKWFNIQIPGTMVVPYSDHHLVNGLVFRPPVEYQSDIQMPGTMVPGIWIANRLNKCHLNTRLRLSGIQTTIWIPKIWITDKLRFVIQMFPLFRSPLFCKQKLFLGMERLFGLKKLKPAAEKVLDIWLQEQVNPWQICRCVTNWATF